MKKRILATLMTLAMSCFLVACGSNSKGETEKKEDSKDEKYTIGLSFGTLEQERLVKERDIMQAKCDELGIELLVQSADGDEVKQNTQCENMLSQGVDLLIVCPIDSESSAQIVTDAHEVNVPVVAYDVMINECDLDYYVSFDSVKVGEEMAKYALKSVPTGNYAIMEIDAANANAALLEEGTMKVLQPLVDKGDIKIVADQNCKDCSGDYALKHMEDALTANNNKIDAVVSHYDGMSNGVIQALADQGMAGKIPVTGQDGELTACQRIVEGTQSMTVFKPTTDLANKVIELAVSLKNGEKPKIDGTVNNGYKDVEAVMPEVYVVDKDNMKEIMVDGGIYTMEEIYVNVPKEEWPK